MIRISDTIKLPVAEHIGKADGGRWITACSVCDRWMWRRNRWILGGAHVCPGCAAGHNAYVDTVTREYTDRKTREQREAIHTMVNHADVDYPDSDTSPGAEWLLQLHNSVTEAWESGLITPDVTHPEDAMREMADAAVPIYTHNRWKIFTDLCAYDFDVDSELLGVDMTDNAGHILQEIAYTAFDNWREEKLESSKCEECDEFPCECPEYGECLECGADAMECYWDWARENGLAPGAGYRVAGPCVV